MALCVLTIGIARIAARVKIGLARIVQLLVDRVDVRMQGVEVRLRPNGLAGVVREVAGSRRAAA